MADIAALKTALRVAIADAQDDGTYSDAGYERIMTAIDALVPHTPLPRPLDDQAKVTDPWETDFAQFGPRHTAGKPKAHDNMFNFLTFGKMPKKPLRVLTLLQEIHHETKDYNNVHDVTNMAGDVTAELIVFGRYDIPEDEPMRYSVEFYGGALRSKGLSDDELRAAFALDADTPLTFKIPKPPKLHSDIVYCDDDLRINFGSMGGKYVLHRLDKPFVSVDL